MSPRYTNQYTDQSSDSVDRGLSARYTDPTDGRTDGRTYEESLSPTIDNPSSSVTRTRTYGFSSDGSENARPGWWTCFLCQPNVHERGGQSAFMAHYLREHYREVKA